MCLSPVTNKIFSVIMYGYVRGLEAIVLKSQKRGEKGDVKLLVSFDEVEVDYVLYRLRHPDLLCWSRCSDGLQRYPDPR